VTVAKRLTQLVSLYSVTATYVAATAVLVLVTGTVLSLAAGLVVLAMAAIAIILVATWREIRVVHQLVATQLNRIEQLTAALTAAGVAVPVDPNRRRR
jgi:hypothetical protein